MAPEPKYWFPAKTFGWGWGLPTRWQGWAVLVGWAASLAILGAGYDPVTSPTVFAIGAAVATTVLIIICWTTGEPPRWRWGNHGESAPGKR